MNTCLPYRGGVGQVRRHSRGEVRVVEGFLVGVHCNLVLTVEPVMPKLGDPFVKQLLGIDLNTESWVRGWLSSSRE